MVEFWGSYEQGFPGVVFRGSQGGKFVCFLIASYVGVSFNPFKRCASGSFAEGVDYGVKEVCMGGIVEVVVHEFV